VKRSPDEPGARPLTQLDSQQLDRSDTKDYRPNHSFNYRVEGCSSRLIKLIKNSSQDNQNKRDDQNRETPVNEAKMAKRRYQHDQVRIEDFD
jgi:hypothetical protein